LHPFQVADDVVQIDVHKTLYPFCTTKNALCYGNSHKNIASLAAMLLFSQYKTIRGSLLSAVTVSYYLPKMFSFSSHMRQSKVAKLSSPKTLDHIQ